MRQGRMQSPVLNSRRSRSLVAVRATTSLPKAPDGEYVVGQYRARHADVPWGRRSRSSRTPTGGGSPGTSSGRRIGSRELRPDPDSARVSGMDSDDAMRYGHTQIDYVTGGVLLAASLRNLRSGAHRGGARACVPGPSATI
ncbi:hypothetical protein [Salinibacter altiplanensis]|uniref:hypothetical protein n=1 Tax=Salinibacter altiplanensis TaxID=1803181 RepID=UPI003C6DE060